MSDARTQVVDANVEPSPSRKLREVVGDAFSFIRGMEANSALATVTLDQLMVDQINRNGETSRSNAQQYDPYQYKPEQNAPATEVPIERANFLGGADTTRPTKLDRVLSVVNSIVDVVKEIKLKQTVDVAKPSEYTDASTVSAPETEG